MHLYKIYKNIFIFMYSKKMGENTPKMDCTQGNITPSHKVLIINQCFSQGFNGLIKLSSRLAASR